MTVSTHDVPAPNLLYPINGMTLLSHRLQDEKRAQQLQQRLDEYLHGAGKTMLLFCCLGASIPALLVCTTEQKTIEAASKGLSP